MMNINQSKNIFTKSDISSARKFTKKQCDLQKAKKKFINKSKGQIYARHQHIIKQRLLKELIRRFHKLTVDKANKELKKLILSKLIDKNISESDLVNIKKLVVLPIETLKKIASLRNINTNLSKGDIVYALVRSEPVFNEEKYILNDNNEVKNKAIEVRQNLLLTSPFISKKERTKVRKRLYDIKNTKKIDRK